MDKLPCQGCKGLCCGPVAVTEVDYKKIKHKIKTMPSKLRSQLQSQKRYYGTCIFYDLNNDRCGIYSARPEVCQKFGYYKELPCFRKPECATKNMEATFKPIGILSLDFTWDSFT